MYELMDEQWMILLCQPAPSKSPPKGETIKQIQMTLAVKAPFGGLGAVLFLPLYLINTAKWKTIISMT